MAGRVSVVTASGYETAIIASGPWHWWPLTDPPGTAEPKDATGGPNLRLVSGATGTFELGVRDPWGRPAACHFNPGSGLVQRDASTVSRIPAVSIMVHYRTDAPIGDAKMKTLLAFSNGQGMNPGSNTPTVRLLGGAPNTGRLSGSQSPPQAIDPARSDDALWHHAVMTWDETANTIRLYRDGEMVASIAGPPSPLYFAGWWRLGMAGSGSGLTGTLSEAVVYNRVLTDREITDLYAAAIAGPPEPPIAVFAPEPPRWRLTVHRRDFGPVAYAGETGITELADARSRRLETALNTPAKLTFTIDGYSAGAAYVHELTTEILAWRWDPVLERDRLMFRGIVAQSEDVISENGAHAVNFTAHDWLAVLNRRYLTNPADWTQTGRDQDDWVADLLARAQDPYSSAGASMAPGSHLPLTLELANPDGTARTAKSGRLRDRTYPGQKSIGEAITEMGACIDGFDTDVRPAADSDGTDYLRVFYPSQGVARGDLVLHYGSSVSALTRSANSAELGYANYVRTIGDNGGTEGAPQLWAERANPDANDVGRIPVGLWMGATNESDVKDAATLQEKADGVLDDSGALIPSYSLTLRPGWYRPGFPAMGDTLGLVVRSGRLDVSSTVRVTALRFVIGDDGQEDVEIDVGRPRLTLSALFRQTRRDVDALARR